MSSSGVKKERRQSSHPRKSKETETTSLNGSGRFRKLSKSTGKTKRNDGAKVKTGTDTSLVPKRIAFLGDYLPRLCGIATFTSDLCEAVAGAALGSDCYVGAVNDRAEGYAYPTRVRFQMAEKKLDSYRRAADFLNFHNADVLSVQHEFGIYGGAAGSHLLALLKEVRMPVVTTLHTVLTKPNDAQREVMQELIKRSDRLIVMARKGAEILEEIYGVSMQKVDIIPHGIPNTKFIDSDLFKARLGVEGRKVLFTFGLIGPGKGIEHVIEALPKIVQQHPEVVYLVLGVTHPHLLAQEGESYRLSLERLADDRGVKEHIIFYNQFLELEELQEFIGATDIYLTPYLEESQITSGTLAYVFGAGKAVISTPYWHAQELLAEGRGMLVPFRDSGAIAKSVCALLDDPAHLNKMRRNAYALGREMIWPAVGERYLESFQRARADRKANPRAAFGGWTLDHRPYDLPPSRLDHLIHMSDGTGIFQHATFTVPNFSHGYCTDDNARAFILCHVLEELGDPAPEGVLEQLATRYLAFLSAAWDTDQSRFRNFMSHGREWLEPFGSEDSQGRALWALGSGVGRSKHQGHRRLAARLFEAGLPIVETFSSPRAWSFALLGIHEYLRTFPEDQKTKVIRANLTKKLMQRWRDCQSKEWPWFESSVTYENARLCQALILSGQWMPCGDALQVGLASLRWLVSIQKTQAGCFRPIGSNGFYEKDGARADFDQQPVEAQAMVSACHEAFRATQDPQWTKEARRAFEWFLGRNDLGLALYDSGTGGCSDGLHADRVNENQGAESTLAFHLSLAEMNYAEQLITRPPISTP
ncbi:MAG: glycosyltransferase family 4 protein [Aliarcobacter sp.]